MAREMKIRFAWLKFMYLYTIAGAGGLGLAIILAPGATQSVFGLPSGEPIMLGLVGSVNLSFALLSMLGLRSPLKYSPILLLQLGYKSVWFAGIILPLLIAGNFPAYAILIAIIFATYIVGDLIAIPFSYLFAKQPDTANK